MSSSLPPRLSPSAVKDLLHSVDEATYSALCEIEYARPIAEEAGLAVQSSVLDSSFGNPCGGDLVGAAVVAGCAPATMGGGFSIGGDPASLEATDIRDEAAAAAHARSNFNPLRGTLSAFPFVLSTTGGHSNVDHIVVQADDGSVDRLSEFRRRLRRRVRRLQPEEKGPVRWDLPRIVGGRRRKIVRDSDAAEAPPEPPQTGYILYISQMTTKLRHDNPGRKHDQISAVRLISTMWNQLPDADKDHYVSFAKMAREEYAMQLREFRATGGWKPSEKYERLGGGEGRFENGPWVRKPYGVKCALEREISTYDKVTFPPRPPEMDEDFNRRTKESTERRKRKLRLERKLRPELAYY